MKIYTDPATGRPYTVDPETRRPFWVDPPPSPGAYRTQELPILQGDRADAGYDDGYDDAGRRAAHDDTYDDAGRRAAYDDSYDTYDDTYRDAGRPSGYDDGRRAGYDGRHGGPRGRAVNRGWSDEPPRRAGGAAMKALGVLAVLIVLGTALALLLSHVVNGGGTASAPARTPGKAAPSKQAAPSTKAAPRPATVGTRVRDGKFEFTVTGSRTTKELGNQFVNTTAAGKFVLVSVTVKNVSDKDKTLVSLAQKLYDTQGREYSVDAGAAVYLWDVKNLVDRIAPGATVQGTLVFDVPADARPDRIELHDSLLSNGVDVRL